jgi:RluA family pseudouridine synthase
MAMQFTFSQTAQTDTTVKRLLASVGVSHRLFKRLVDGRCIRLQQRVVGNVPVAAGATVTFVLPEETGVTPSTNPIDVVFENDNWLVVNKPALLSSVPGPANPADSLLNRIAGYLEAAGYHQPQPAIITRLDRDTRGLVLAAKHPFAQGRLDQLGSAAQVDKRYTALVTGNLPEIWGSIRRPLGQATDGIHQEVRRDGKPARTDYRVLERATDASLLELHLLTGRTHQIRVHMASAGHPLIGDALYGGPTTRQTGQALMATALTFVDPFTNKAHKITTEFPTEWHV